jgi:hypothetical protein
MKVQTNLKSGSLLQDISTSLQSTSSQVGQFLAKANREAAQITNKSAVFATTLSGCLASSLNRPS